MISGLAQKVVSLLLPFVIRTIMIKQLGTEYLGVSSLFTSILQALSLAELGLGSALVFNMYNSVAENDNLKLCAYMNFYKKCYRIIGAFILVAGLILTPFLPNIIHGSYPDDINIYIVYFVYLGNTVLSYWMFAYKNSIALAYQRNDIENGILLLTQTAMFAAQIALLIIFKNYYIYVIVIPLSTFLKNVLVSIRIDKIYPEIRAKGKLTKEESRKVFENVKALFGHQIAFTVINSADNIVLSATLGLNELTIYNNYYYIFNAVMAILTIYFHSIQAGIGNDIILNKENIFDNFKRFRISTLFVVEMAGACLFVLTQPFMKIWMGTSLMYSELVVIVFVIGFYITQMRKVVTTYKNAAGMWKIDFYKPYIVIVVDLVVDLILIQKIGAIGAMISTVVSMGLIAVPWETIVLYKNLFKKNALEYFAFMGIQVCFYILTLVGLRYLFQWIAIDGIKGLIIDFVITVVLEGILLILFNLRKPEFRWLIKRMKTLITKRV